MRQNLKFFIGGQWVAPSSSKVLDVINPATEQAAGVVAMGTALDVDLAVAAARDAFNTYSLTSVQERLALFDRIGSAYERRAPHLAKAITEEMGAPSWLAEQMQVVLGGIHIRTAREVLAQYRFSEMDGSTRLVREPIGVCALITPWNWPLNQIACKVVPALAVGCTIVLKPSEVAPFSATIFAEILEEAGVPPGVFNLVHGDGSEVGYALTSHEGVDLVSFTGSTRAGIEVARTAAATVKRVHQELGGKSPNIILPSADLKASVASGVTRMMLNSGQSCNAATRMLVPSDQMEAAKLIAKTAAEAQVPGPPDSNAKMGPVASAAQWHKIQRMIELGVEEGATLVTGGTGRPEGLDIGFYVKPTIFGDVTNNMTIAREEVFGPVLAILGYDDEDDAVRIANDTPYGLSAYVQGDDDEAQALALRLRAGQVLVNGAVWDFNAPFGGFKQSGNGREWGKHAFAEFVELKAIMA